MTHPKFLFTADELPQLRRRIAAGPRSRRLFQYALSVCDRLIDPASDVFFDFVERKSYYWHNRRGNFIIPGRLLTLSLVGHLADRRDLLEAAVAGWMAIIDNKLYDALGDYTKWRTEGHDAGKYFTMTGLLYDLLYPLLTDEQRRRALAHAEQTVALGYSLWPANRLGYDNNRNNRFITGLTLLAATIKEEKLVDHAALIKPLGETMRAMHTSLRMTFDRDGVPFEGASYGLSNLMFFVIAAHILHRAGVGDRRHDRRFIGNGDYAVHEMVLTEGWINNLNDCHSDRISGMLYYAGVAGRNPACLWLWDRYAMDEKHPLSVVAPDSLPDDFQFIPFELLWPDDEAPAAAPPDACGYPTARYFSDRGILSVRSGWRDDDLHVTLFAGRQNPTSHQQADQGQVTLYALGEKFLVDSGYVATLASGQTETAKETHHHNLIEVDGVGQCYRTRGDGHPEGLITACDIGADYTCAVADLHDAYDANRDLRRAERQLHVVRSASTSPYALWLDDFEVDGREHEYTLYLHTGPGNRFERTDTGFTVHGSKQCMDIHLATSSAVTVRDVPRGDHPCVALTLHDVRARFAIMLHPRKAGPASMHVDLGKDVVRSTVEIDGRTIQHTFDTAQRTPNNPPTTAPPVLT